MKINTIKTFIAAIKKSKFANDAIRLFVINLAGRALLFFANIYAAKCLGPVNLGISAQILAIVQQASLAYNGGLDTVVVRKIAVDETHAKLLFLTVVSFRLIVAVFVAVVWVIFTFIIVNEDNLRVAWLLGAFLLVMGSLNISFLYQALQRLPIQAVFGTLVSVMSAAAYFYLFYSDIFVGADLMVVAFSMAISNAALWGYYFKFLVTTQTGTSIVWRSMLYLLRDLLKKSWRYWALAVIVFSYSTLQIPLIGYFLGDYEAGIFRSALFMAAGVELFFNSITSLLLPKLTVWSKSGLNYMWQRQTQLLKIFMLIGLLPILILIALSEFIYTTFLGAQFINGIVIFQILLIGRFVVFLGQIYAWGLAATHQDAQFLYSSIFGAVTSIALSIIFVPSFGIISAAIISVISEIIVHFSCFIFMRLRVLNNHVAL